MNSNDLAIDTLWLTSDEADTEAIQDCQQFKQERTTAIMVVGIVLCVAFLLLSFLLIRVNYSERQS